MLMGVEVAWQVHTLHACTVTTSAKEGSHDQAVRSVTDFTRIKGRHNAQTLLMTLFWYRPLGVGSTFLRLIRIPSPLHTASRHRYPSHDRHFLLTT